MAVNAGKLIKDYDEHVNRDNFKEAKVPKMYGVYALYNFDGLCYIGLATNLHKRISTHLRSKRKKWTNFSWYVIPKMKFVKDVETILIRIIHPKYNKVSGKFHKIKKIISTVVILFTFSFLKAQSKVVSFETIYSITMMGSESEPEEQVDYTFYLTYDNGNLTKIKSVGAGETEYFDKITYAGNVERGEYTFKTYYVTDKNQNQKETLGFTQGISTGHGILFINTTPNDPSGKDIVILFSK